MLNNLTKKKKLNITKEDIEWSMKQLDVLFKDLGMSVVVYHPLWGTSFLYRDREAKLMILDCMKDHMKAEDMESHRKAEVIFNLENNKPVKSRPRNYIR